MPKDFNELLGNDYEFTVREHTFTFRDISPRAFDAIDAILQGTNGAGKEDKRPYWERFSDQIEAFLPEDQRGRWRDLYSREEDPVTVGQLIGIRNWLMEVQIGDRPTLPPAPSTPGRGKTAPSSKGA